MDKFDLTHSNSVDMDDSNTGSVHNKDDPSVKLTIRLIMQGKVRTSMLFNSFLSKIHIL